MTADVELLPCPCGAAAAIHNTGVSAGPKEKVVVACVDPECHWSMTGYGAKQAATRWNRRATAAKDAEIEALRAERDLFRDETIELVRQNGEWQARAELLAEALREIERHALFRGNGDLLQFVRAALHSTAAQENK